MSLHPKYHGLRRHFAVICLVIRESVDGPSAESRRRGRPWRKPALQFGERRHCKPAAALKGDAVARMLEGHCVGHQGTVWFGVRIDSYGSTVWLCRDPHE